MPFLGGRGQASRGYFGGGTTPDAPTAVVATRGNTQLSVAFSAPAFNGGLEITTYEYALSTNSYATWTTRATGTTASPLVITGLSNGTPYQVKLRAVNTLGAGAASTASTAVTPATIPGTPTSPSISSTSGSISVSWVAPSDGGDPPLTYTVETQKNSEAYVNRGAQTSPYPLSGLDNGATYRARITANNTVGSSATAAVTGDTVPSAVPNAPGFSSASSGSGTYTFNWTAPANNGAAISGYTVTLTTANQTAWGTAVTNTPANFTSGGNLTYMFSGLSNGSSYRAKVLATNVRGNSAETDSSTGGEQIPSTTPGAPTISSQSSGDQSYTVNWDAPTSNGGAAIDYYEVQITDANEQNWSTIASPNPTGTTKTFTGLTNGSTYRTRVRAHNVRGFGGYVESTAQTPSTIPNNVATPTSSAGDRSFTISWVEPGNGGSAITTYWVQYSTDNENWSTVVDVGDVLTKTWTGDGTDFRNNGTTYYGRVIAFNSRGNSVAWSAGSTGRIPVFTSAGTISVVTEPTSAPTYNENGTGVVTAGVGHSGYRVMNVSFDPPNVSAFSYSFLQAHNAAGTFGNCTDANYTALVFGSEGQTQSIASYNDTSYFGIIQQFYPGYNYTFRLVTVNTDGDSVISAETSLTATGYQPYYTYDGAQQTTTSLTSYINANSYTNDVGSASHGTDTKTYSVTCWAASTTGSSTICTNSRYFVSQWAANTSYSGLTSYTGLQAPWSNNAGTAFRDASIGATSPYGSGLRVRVIGNGSIASNWNPTISVYYVIKYRNRYYSSW